MKRSRVTLFLEMLAGFILIVLFIETSQFVTAQYLRSASHYVEYYSLDVIAPVQCGNDAIEVNSLRSIKKEGVLLEYDDILKCRVPGIEEAEDYNYISIQSTEGRTNKITDNEIATWDYAERRPSYEADCIIDAHITVIPRQFVEHHINIESSSFRVNAC